MSKPRRRPAAPRAASFRNARTRPAADAPPAFDPVRIGYRGAGWTPDRQDEFIAALAECGCVEHAARAAGMSASAAYRLRARPDAQSFRAAWDHAIEFAVQRLADATLSRAIHGTARPVFYKGEQIGERRYYDERLAMFILRLRDPSRFGSWIDRVEGVERHPDAAAIGLARAAVRADQDACADAEGAARPDAAVSFPRYLAMTADHAMMRELKEAQEEAQRHRENADGAWDALEALEAHCERNGLALPEEDEAEDAG